MECKKARNAASCKCTHSSCSNRGMCCDCVAYHREAGQIPGCFFDEKSEREHDRSTEFFIKSRSA
ncbi:MAG: DUF6485 family protein [Elusimicrobiales bacterium]